MTKGCRLLPLYQTSPIPLHLEVLQTLTSFFCLVLFVLHQLASHQLQFLDPQAMHQPGYERGRMNLESLMKPCYLQIHDKHQIQKVFRSTAIDQIPASQWIYACCHELKESQTEVLLDWFYYKLFAKLLKKCYSPCLRWKPDFRTVRIENTSSNQSIFQVTKRRAEAQRHKPAHILKTGRLETDRREISSKVPNSKPWKKQKKL